ncbi:hypothetical protein K2X05_03385 [bacterium]|nr:hypothetical protein [bacterium]
MKKIELVQLSIFVFFLSLTNVALALDPISEVELCDGLSPYPKVTQDQDGNSFYVCSYRPTAFVDIKQATSSAIFANIRQAKSECAGVGIKEEAPPIIIERPFSSGVISQFSCK